MCHPPARLGIGDSPRFFFALLATICTLLMPTRAAEPEKQPNTPVTASETGGSLAGTWIGGIETSLSDEDSSPDFLPARLQFVRSGETFHGNWEVLDRPGRVSGTIDEVTGSEAGLAFSAIGATVRASLEADALIATLTWSGEEGERRRPGRWTRMADLDPSALQRHAGTYHFPTGETFRIDAVEPGFLRMLDVETGEFRNLYPGSSDEFFHGPDFERPLPVQVRVAFRDDRVEFRNAGESDAPPTRVARSLGSMTRPVEWTAKEDTATLRLSPNVAMTFLRVEPGTFDMGERMSTEELVEALALPATVLDDPSARDPHHGLVRRVTLTNGFWMGQFEVTNRQFAAFVAATGYMTDAERRGWGMRWTHDGFRRELGRNWRFPGYDLDPEQPVTMVTWYDAVAFADWLADTTGLSFRLPTEAEWEYAARAGSGTLFDYGDDVTRLEAHAHFGQGEHEDRWFPIPVGSKLPNRWGFHDMQGNVYEWTLDRGGDLTADPVTDPRGPEEGPGRILRGGSWLNRPYSLRLAFRPHDAPSLKEPHFGFRLVAGTPP